jgi:imidazole glycerol-phosphate synthase subunit HisH
MSNLKVTVIDYGMGNLWSVLSALSYLGANSITSRDPDDIIRADALLLPGVGSFQKAMTSLKNGGLDQAIIEAVKKKGTTILGICLGMQLMGLSSAEGGDTEGLGLIPANVERFTFDEVGINKIPHIGFDKVRAGADWRLFNDLQNNADFYFVHSYRMLATNLSGKCGICNYGVDFLAAYEENNIFATQFHPEKSQANGLILLKNYLSQIT